MLAERERAFLLSQRVARLASADARGEPHVVPVCFAVAGETVYITVDEKPKQTPGRTLKRIRNLVENPAVAHWWPITTKKTGGASAGSCCGVRAEILHEGEEHDRAQALLCERYAQYREMSLAALPVIAIRIARVASWGDLDASRAPRTAP